MKMSQICRASISALTRRLPEFRGLGRFVLQMDSWLTSQMSEHSYMAIADVNGGCRLLLDIRGWEQKFAFYYGRWEDTLISSVKRHFDHDVFYDVGASIGLYSTTFGIVCRDRNTYVRAFEPVPTNLARLRQQLSLNGLNESLVRIEATALGEKAGSVNVRLTDSDRAGNAKVVSEGGVVVPMATLDRIWESHYREPVGFIKIDTEGWDCKILAGGRELLRICRPNLLVEFNRERMRNLQIPMDETWRFLLDELNYKCFRVDRGGNEIPIDDFGDWENLLFLSGETHCSASSMKSTRRQ